MEHLLTGTAQNESQWSWAATTEYNFPSGAPAVSDVPKYTQRTDDWHGRTAASPTITYYDAPEPVAGQDARTTITVKDKSYDPATGTSSSFEVDRVTVSHNTGDWKDGLVKETSVVKRFGPFNQQTNQYPYSAVMQKTVYFWEQGTAAFGARKNPVLRKIGSHQRGRADQNRPV